MRISDLSSDVCSSDLLAFRDHKRTGRHSRYQHPRHSGLQQASSNTHVARSPRCRNSSASSPCAVRRSCHLWRWIWTGRSSRGRRDHFPRPARCRHTACRLEWRSEEHTSELQSLMRISYAVFCLKKKKKKEEHNILTELHI